MSGRKNSDPGGNRQQHAGQSFQDMVAAATLQKFAPYIQQQVGLAIRRFVQATEAGQEALFTRIVALEAILIERIPGLTKDDLVNMVATKQDEAEGYQPREGGVEPGDRVRLEIRTKGPEATDWDGESRMLVDNAGSGRHLGPEIELELIGMKAGETKEFPFGKDKAFTAQVVINRISCQPKDETPTEAPVAETTAAPAETPPAPEAEATAPAAEPAQPEATDVAATAG